MDAQDIATVKKAIGDAVAMATVALQVQPNDPDYLEVFKSSRFFQAVNSWSTTEILADKAFHVARLTHLQRSMPEWQHCSKLLIIIRQDL